MSPDFGETCEGRQSPTLFLLTWASEVESTGEYRPEPKICELDIKVDHPTPTFFGQAIFAFEDVIYATGYSEMSNGRKLGMAGGHSRHSAIYRINLGEGKKGESTSITTIGKVISDPQHSSRSPRLSDAINGTRQLIWLSNDTLGPHSSCTRLNGCKVNMSDDHQEEIIIDRVWKPKDSTSFPGLYIDQLPDQPFNTQGLLTLNTIWGSKGHS